MDFDEKRSWILCKQFGHGNGTITTEDITLLQKYLLNEFTLTETQYNLADLNADGTVNGFDLVLLRQKLLA